MHWILVHGSATDRQCWRPLVRLLAPTTRVTIYDRRGAPEWPRDTTSPRVSDHVQDLCDLIQYLGCDTCCLMGVSFGAVVVLDFCRSYPHLLQGAVLFEPPIDAKGHCSPFSRRLLEGFRAAYEPGTHAAIDWYFARLLGVKQWGTLPEPLKRQARSFESSVLDDLTANIAHTHAVDAYEMCDFPVLLLSGDRPHNPFDETIAQIRGWFRHATVRRVANCGHVITGPTWREIYDLLSESMPT